MGVDATAGVAAPGTAPADAAPDGSFDQVLEQEMMKVGAGLMRLMSQPLMQEMLGGLGEDEE